MATLTVRNIDDDLKLALRKQAAANNRSMEEEARLAFQSWVRRPHTGKPGGLGSFLRARFEAAGRVEFNVPQRTPSRPLPNFFEE